MTLISLSQIAIHDRTFCASYPLHDETLLASIREVGILQPLILRGTPPYQVVSGFRRLHAAATLGHESVPALVRELSDRDAFLHNLHANLPRAFNLVEKANILDRMAHLGFSRHEMGRVVARLDVPAHDKYLTVLTELAWSEEAFKDFVVTRNPSLQTLQLFLRLPAQIRAQLLDLFTRLRASESDRREVLTLLNLMTVKEGGISPDLWTEVSSITELKGRIRHRIYPLLTGLEGELEAVRRQCALPPHMDIKVDPSFEKEYIDIAFRAANEDETENALRKLERLLREGFIGRIFELTKGRVR